jgi:Na+/H+ antiporter NhaD/arsenite permease-like protein
MELNPSSVMAASRKHVHVKSPVRLAGERLALFVDALRSPSCPVGALVETGAIARLSELAAGAAEGRLAAASVGPLWGSAILSGLVDNIPYVATMSPVVADLVEAEGGGVQARSLWWSLALGADLGGNATAVGASANVVVLGLAARAGTPISFWQFTRYGLITTLVTVGIATPYVLLRYFVLT